jgi:hypothetical protein
VIECEPQLLVNARGKKLVVPDGLDSLISRSRAPGGGRRIDRGASYRSESWGGGAAPATRLTAGLMYARRRGLFVHCELLSVHLHRAVRRRAGRLRQKRAKSNRAASFYHCQPIKPRALCVSTTNKSWRHPLLSHSASPLSSQSAPPRISG